MRLAVNKEFLVRHLFSLAVFLALCGWFGFDAFRRYPATPAKDLYFSIEKSEPPEGFDLESFKAQKMQTQRILALLTLLASLGIGVHLIAVARFDFEFDDEGFSWNGRRFAYGEIRETDVSKWEKKNVLAIRGENWRILLDAWHHRGVREFFGKLQKREGNNE